MASALRRARPSPLRAARPCPAPATHANAPPLATLWALQEIGRIYKAVVRELQLQEELGAKQLEGSHPHSYMRRFMSLLSMTPREYLWGEQLTLALLPQARGAGLHGVPGA